MSDQELSQKVSSVSDQDLSQKVNSMSDQPLSQKVSSVSDQPLSQRVSSVLARICPRRKRNGRECLSGCGWVGERG